MTITDKIQEKLDSGELQDKKFSMAINQEGQRTGLEKLANPENYKTAKIEFMQQNIDFLIAENKRLTNENVYLLNQLDELKAQIIAKNNLYNT